MPASMTAALSPRCSARPIESRTNEIGDSERGMLTRCAQRGCTDNAGSQKIIGQGVIPASLTAVFPTRTKIARPIEERRRTWEFNYLEKSEVFFLFDDLKSKYKHIDPTSLEGYGLLTPAKKSGYICPFCSNGTGKDGTGASFEAVNDGFKGFCFKCGEHFDVFDLIAAHHHFNRKNFREIFDAAKNIFGDAPKVSDEKPRKKEIQNFESLIRSSWRGLDDFFYGKKNWRGLFKSTLVKFGCGYLNKWLSDGTERIIIPTGFTHYLARFPYETDDPKIVVKPHRGTKEIFGLKFALQAVQANIDVLVFAVEGEIDAMSIYQCGFTAIAFSGSDISPFQQTLLAQFPKGSKFILMFDSDETGKKKSQKSADVLRKIGFFVSVQFLDDKFSDANARLQTDPAGLKNELTKIYSDAEKFFAANPPQKVSALPEGIKPAEVEGYVEITPDYKPPKPPDKISENVEGMSTQMQIPSCPLDLSVPANFLFEAGGLKVKVFDKKTGEEKEPVIFSKTPILPVKIFRKADKSDMQVELAYYERVENAWHKVTVPMTTIAKTQNITDLASFGVDVNSPHAKDFSNFLMRIQRISDNAKKIPKILIYEQTGWTGENYEKFIYPPGESDFVVQNGGFDYESKFSAKGSKEDWVRLFLPAYASRKHVWCRYALGLVLAAPLVRLCNSRNWQGVLVAPSGSAKSAIAKLAISIFGNPEKLHTTFNGTSSFTDELSPRLNDLPCWVDEFQAADETMRKNFQQLIYNYAEGKTRGRLSRNAEVKKQYEFSGTRLCTSEQVVMQDSFMQGAFNRTIQIQGIAPLPDYLARKFHSELHKTYGHFGKQFVEYVKAHREAVRELYSDLQKTYEGENFITHHVQHISLVYTALEFFFRMLREEFDVNSLDTPLEYLSKGDIEFFRTLLPSPRESNNIVRAREFLAETRFSQENRFHRITKDGDLWPATSGKEALGYKFANGDVGFLPGPINKFFLENGYPPAQTLMRGFAEQNLLKVSGGNLGRQFKYTVRIADRGAPKLYYFPKNSLEDADT